MARALSPAIDWQEGTTEALPFPDRSFDAVVCQFGSRLPDLGQEMPPREWQTPEALGALQKAEIEKWWPIITAANIKAE